MSADIPLPEQAGGTNGLQGNTLQFVYSVVTRHWVLICLLTLVGGLGFGSFGLLTAKDTARFQARTELVVMQSQWLKVMGGQANTPGSLLELVSKRTLSEDIARTLVQDDLTDGGSAASAVSTAELAREAARIHPVLTLEAVPNSSSIAISYVSDTDRDAQRVTEIAARVFIDSCTRFLMEEEEDTHDFVKQQMDGLRSQLEQAENQEWEFRQQMGFRTHDQVTEEMDRMNEELIAAETTRALTIAKMQEIEKEFSSKNESLPSSLGDVSESVVETLRKELAALYAQELSMSVVYQPDFEGFDGLRQDIEEKKQAILTVVREAGTGISAGTSVWDDRERLRDQYMQLQTEMTSLEIRTKTIESMLEGKVQRLPDLAAKSLDYQKYAREAEQLRKQFEKVMDKEFDIRTSLRRGSGQIERNTPVDVTPLARRAASAWWMNFVIGGTVGFVLGLCLAMLFEGWDTSIRSIEDVTEYIGIEVIGTIPRMAFGKTKFGMRHGASLSMVDEDEVDACIVTQHDPKSPISEAYRALRTNFQFATIQNKPKTVLVTSAVPGEGKTTTAVNMAVTMADSGMRVLMIDTDLRRPNVHHVLKMERGPGLADVLRQGLDINSVIRPTRVKNLWIISSGRVPPNPSELIGSDRMHRVLDHLKGRFDVILCDAPSVLVVTDPVLLSTFIDTVVLVVSVNNARRETIIRARQLLNAAKANIAGVVLNGLEASRRHYYYYYYYYDEGDRRGQKRWYHF